MLIVSLLLQEQDFTGLSALIFVSWAKLFALQLVMQSVASDWFKVNNPYSSFSVQSPDYPFLGQGKCLYSPAPSCVCWVSVPTRVPVLTQAGIRGSSTPARERELTGPTPVFLFMHQTVSQARRASVCLGSGYIGSSVARELKQETRSTPTQGN